MEKRGVIDDQTPDEPTRPTQEHVKAAEATPKDDPNARLRKAASSAFADGKPPKK